MTAPSYASAPVPVRSEIAQAHIRAWARISAPGTWFDGAQRIAIAAEARRAQACTLCRQRRNALSPYGVAGDHECGVDLPSSIVEIIHRVTTDPGRLTERWYRQCLDDGLSEEQYVETVAVTVTVIALDTYTSCIGMPPHALPAPRPGQPSRYRPAGAKQSPAWVPWISPADATGAEADLYTGGSAAHIRRALTLVPDEQRGFFDLVVNQYLSGPQMRDFGHEFRAITHAQIELVAGRVSALNQCVY